MGVKLFLEKMVINAALVWFAVRVIVGTFIVESKLFRWVFPMPACRDPNTTLVLISLTRGPQRILLHLGDHRSCI